MPAQVVIVGAGQGGLQVAASLRQEGYEGNIVLVGDEPGVPYQRPPLSKAYMLGASTAADLALKADSFFADQRIDYLAGERVFEIDRTGRTVALGAGQGAGATGAGATGAGAAGADSGVRLPFDHLVLATGARNRPLPVPGADLDGVVSLRTLADAADLKARLAAASEVVVIGAGFIGLEFASVAAKLGRRVTVVEAVGRPMARVVSPPISAHFVAAHERAGTVFRFGAGVARLLGDAGRVAGVELAGGERLSADLVVVGIGVLANAELAAAAGLAVANGVEVDATLATGDPAISAIGDCALHPSRWCETPVRIESVQNAIDQAKCVAARLVGRPAPYTAVPWFWSDQGADKLQTAGLAIGADRAVVRGDPESGRFSAFVYRGEKLLAVESVNRPADHMIARRLLAAGLSPSPDEAADEGVDLKALAGPPARGTAAA
jgi:3-phenylpropionate/trans-cinnamate dioxygenase ferredoxin reductase subunit